MPKLKPNTIMPTAQEDAAMTAAAMADPDAQPLSDAQWEQAKPSIKRGRPLGSAQRLIWWLRMRRGRGQP